jgi:DNA-binding transcriptional regulator GbsR (MarR family)
MDELTQEERFIEEFGMFLERVGFARIAGRILGLLLLQGDAMHLEQLASQLQVSKASISTNTRILVSVQIIQEYTRPGDRRTWFRVAPDAFIKRLDFVIAQFHALHTMLKQGLALVPPERSIAHTRLNEAVDFHAFMLAELSQLLERWNQRQTAHSLGENHES